jgi:hypothetical protein
VSETRELDALGRQFVWAAYACGHRVRLVRVGQWTVEVEQTVAEFREQAAAEPCDACKEKEAA